MRISVLTNERKGMLFEPTWDGKYWMSLWDTCFLYEPIRYVDLLFGPREKIMQIEPNSWERFKGTNEKRLVICMDQWNMRIAFLLFYFEKNEPIFGPSREEYSWLGQCLFFKVLMKDEEKNPNIWTNERRVHPFGPMSDPVCFVWTNEKRVHILGPMSDNVYFVWTNKRRGVALLLQ